MIDAVESGGFGVLGLYGVQAATVPEPPRPTAATTVRTEAGAPALAPVEPAKAVGSGPVAAADPGADSGAASGREFSRDNQALARQAAVAVSLAGVVTSGGDAAAAAVPSGSSQATPHRASRAYARTRAIHGTRPAGAMFTAKA